MLRVKQQKHLAFFDEVSSYMASYQLVLQRYQKEDKQKNNDLVFKQPTSHKSKVSQFVVSLKIQSQFTFQWESEYYKIEKIVGNYDMGSFPYSLQAYLQVYNDPKIKQFKLSLLSQNTSEETIETMFETVIGKIIIKTRFKGNPFKLPVSILDKNNVFIQSPKTVTVVIKNLQSETVVCSGNLMQVSVFNDVPNFQSIKKHSQGYKLYKFKVEERVQSQNVVVAKGNFKLKQLIYDKATVKIYSYQQDFVFIPTLMQILQQIKSVLGEMQSISIIQNMPTRLEDGYHVVFYADLSTLYKRVYRSVLYDKVRDKWLIEGMVSYNRSNKHFQDVMKDLIDLMTEGEELVPLEDEIFHFDKVWKIKATFFYHILSNFKTMRDYGSSNLASLIVQESKKTKITSQILFRRLKNKYGLKNFRTIYQRQFLQSTGINRIFYQIIDLKRENKVKIIVRQKALANKVFKLYNLFRIKLEQEFTCISTLTEKIINKNKFADTNNKKKELLGPLAVPAFLKCIPYFRGTVAVQTDASQMAFELQLKEENIIEEKQNVTSKIRAPIRKVGDVQKAYQGFGWMMIDTAHIFPAVYKNQNVHQSVILQKIKKRYDSQHEQIKVLNCISSKDHSNNQKICKSLLDKVKIYTNLKENSTINVKRKVLQILPIFLSKATDFSLWQDMLSLIKLYEPVCHDHSEEGYQFLLGLVQSIGEIQYRHQFYYYFQHFHRILLSIIREVNSKGEDRQQKLKMAIFNSLMKWNSKYSLQILDQVHVELRLCQGRLRANLQILKVIFKNIYNFISYLKFSDAHSLISKIQAITSDLIKKDKTFQLWGIKFKFDLLKRQSEVGAFDFLKEVFGIIQELMEQSQVKYGLGLEIVKDILNINKKRWGLQIQLTLTQNQNYFIAEYIWKSLTSILSSNNHFIRLQWIKIYRIFYFYYIPVVSIIKLKKNFQTNQFPMMTEEAVRDLLQHLKDFYPDIKWLSGYDSRSAKELKAKYEQQNENRRKKRFQEYNFSQNNVITMFVKLHPGRETWDELAREAIRIFINIYEDKQQKSEGRQAQRCKHIQQGFRKVEQKLKRGRMPDFYNYQQLKDQIRYLMQQYQEEEVRVIDILAMVDKALQQMAQQKARRENQLRDQMRIIINLDSIHQQEEDEAANQGNEGGDDQMIFGYNEAQGQAGDSNKQDADDDLLFAE